MEQHKCEVIPANKNSGMFRPGQSGNPAGRPKANIKLKELAGQHTELAINTLAEIAADPKAKESARVQAASALLDRAYGKPAQYVESIKMGMSYEDWLDHLARQENLIVNEPVLEL